MPTKKPSRTLIGLIFITWCAALTWLLYGNSLSLPFFFDDFVHLPFVDAHNLSEIWRTAGNLAYYRPLPFTIWKLVYLALDRHDPVLLHGLNLLLHFLNSLLTGWLAYRLWLAPKTLPLAKPMASIRLFGSATLFLVFPFSYQAVPWVGSLAHLLVTLMVLTSLVAYWLFRESNRLFWAVISLAMAILAPFSHENGVLIGPLLAAILVTGPDFRSHLRRNGRDIILWSIPALLWFPIWWLAPKGSGSSVTVQNLEALLQNLAYSTQGAAYPLTWLGGRLRQLLGSGDMMTAAGLTLLALLGAALVQVLSRASRRSLLPWLWVVIAIFPTILFLDFDYVINGPRLLMLASVGMAWLWVDVVVQAINWLAFAQTSADWQKWVPVTLIVALVGLTLAQNILFVRYRMALHHLLGQVYGQAVELTAETNDSDHSAVFVNLPSWIAPPQATFALGHEGVQFWPDYAPTDTLASVNNGRPAQLSLLRNEAIRPEMPYHYGLSGAGGSWDALPAGENDVFVAAYDPDQITLVPAGTQTRAGTLEQPLAIFSRAKGESTITLAEARATQDGEELVIDLLWYVDQPPADQVTAFVHILDSAGQMTAQIDGDPLAGTFPFIFWSPNTWVWDRRRTFLNESDWTILVGLYDRLSGERLSAQDASGWPWPEDAIAIELE